MALELDGPLAPGAVIGILGGGQLGRMAALAAARLGYRCHIYCPDADAPAAQVTDRATVAAYDDEAALARFAGAVDVVTFEFENIPFATVERLGALAPLRPSAEVLRICQDRGLEKDFCRGLGVPTAGYARVANPDELADAIAALGTPCVLKTARLGYDGKGQALIEAGGDPAAAWAAMAGHAPSASGILEAFVDFALEISVIVARAADGTTRSYVPVENRHRNHILDRTLVPAEIAPDVAARADAVARGLAEGLGLIGLLAVEMFVTKDGQVLVNELAPRPHNSGHWTIDAALTSQFEQFVRAVAGLPLGATARHGDAEMRNLLGDEADAWREILSDPAAKLHLYGKAEARPGRKMGHVTRLKSKS
ncbi:MAG: 5-(carboxyamino)imidazole ribonucleotide synthase [Kiloniellales bacterium]|nr:5-(carboxyamino)imidazole ribonucleotide synthase [Kiloniellales bacterium]